MTQTTRSLTQRQGLAYLVGRSLSVRHCCCFITTLVVPLGRQPGLRLRRPPRARFALVRHRERLWFRDRVAGHYWRETRAGSENGRIRVG